MTKISMEEIISNSISQVKHPDHLEKTIVIRTPMIEKIAKALRDAGFIHKSEIRVPEKIKPQEGEMSLYEVGRKDGFNSAIDKVKEINNLNDG